MCHCAERSYAQCSCGKCYYGDCRGALKTNNFLRQRGWGGVGSTVVYCTLKKQNNANIKLYFLNYLIEEFLLRFVLLYLFHLLMLALL
jgi:hypothetical protein